MKEVHFHCVYDEKENGFVVSITSDDTGTVRIRGVDFRTIEGMHDYLGKIIDSYKQFKSRGTFN